jgi:hypothetical protein
MLDTKTATMLAAILHTKAKGAAAALTNTKVASLLNSQSGVSLTAREMRLAIQQLRLTGSPICSTSKGYFWAANKQELRTCIESLRARIEAEAKTADALFETYTTLYHPTPNV